MKRYITLAIPGRDDEPGTWYVYDRQKRTSERCESMAAAVKLAKAKNAEG
jgi:hypothetical protein